MDSCLELVYPGPDEPRGVLPEVDKGDEAPVPEQEPVVQPQRELLPVAAKLEYPFDLLDEGDDDEVKGNPDVRPAVEDGVPDVPSVTEPHKGVDAGPF